MRYLLLSLALGCTMASGQSEFVPAGGNAWVTGGTLKLTKEGVTDWTESSSVQLYLRLDPGDLNLSLVLHTEKPVRLKVDLLGHPKEIAIDPALQLHPVGTWMVAEAGYVRIVISGLFSGTLQGLSISGTSVNTTNSFVRDNEGNFFYWGRRGPSVHLRFDLKGRADIEWFYSEITVPAENDVVGSYYMANGFTDGYFGFQVNSETERRILFSVWSPFKTDDPKTIPEEDKIILVKKGEGVNTGEFGNEGSGGQSFLRYPWKAGTTYGFLLRGTPEEQNTVYTAWFYSPEESRWMLIASWRRPKQATYLTSLYSFLENFVPETGNVERRANYGNQWVRDTAGKWIELTETKFTGDNTARKSYRKDYGGGVSGESFFLRNCGFFNDFTPLDQSFTRPFKGKPPVVDLKRLP